MDDFYTNIAEDMADLKIQLESCTKGDLCELLEGYIKSVGMERTIGTKEYKSYIELLTDEIDKKI